MLRSFELHISISALAISFSNAAGFFLSASKSRFGLLSMVIASAAFNEPGKLSLNQLNGF